MDEQDYDSKIDKYTKEKLAKDRQLLEEEKELKIKWRNEIDQNEQLQLYLSNYQKKSAEDFIVHYINQKYQVYRYGDMYIQIDEEQRSKWIDIAHEHLKAILQKKLFDLQCQWRAEEIKLNFIEKCIDFHKWENEIFNCPLVKPISEAEIKMYKTFLLKSKIDFANGFSAENWQDYDSIKEVYLSSEKKDDNSIPTWYQYHFNKTGSSKLLLLPDIRGEKEEFYIKIWREHENKKIKEKLKDQPIKLTDNRPYLSSYNDEVTAYLFDHFEDYETQKRYHYYKMAMDDTEDTFHYEDIFRELIEQNESIPIKSNNNIKEAVVAAYNSYYAKKIAEHLPLAYEQYLLNRKMGFVIRGDKDFFGELDDMYTKSILGGRELNGEPRDFNF
ncbi:hypothetical protein WFZ85_13820 [Flavobacterium sp. j3]|uniref:Uncharacterized protein n=1 Tax=Flavobacterium aureirubrum TaxID=3133147 RepID=A0ABU9N8S4_9FLAO